jgi:hypothetical protein
LGLRSDRGVNEGSSVSSHCKNWFSDDIVIVFSDY